ncbi:NAD-dependent DNA ligase LigA, partial [Peptococcaceae bacterium]|nr:NAD-dependent DNA ligase LigA [Peptococcaceae bacterium]
SLLKGKSFVLTGKLESFTRTQAQELIESLGGKVSSQVSKRTDYVVAGKDPGSKLERAKKLRVKIIDEDEFKNMILMR